MLLGFLAMYFQGPDPHTFDMVVLRDYGIAGGFSQTFQLIVFGAVALGFAVKVPMWPFHTWLPDAHTEAPTIGSVLLAGIMLKMGTYGFIRIAIPFMPYGAQKYAPWIGALAAIAIVYAALACLAQKDLKRLIAFSSVGHMGFVMLGIATLTEIGIQAAIFGMVAHGVITGMLFFCVGSIYDRYHTREIAKIGGGMLQTMPKLGSVFAFVAIASLGLPGLAGFWGEVMALLSSFDPNEVFLADQVGLFRVFMVMGGIGTVLTAGYFLWMLQRVNMGTLFVAIASLGLPGLAGFWGEVMALLSSFSPNEFVLGDQVGLFRVFMVMGGIGTVLTAGYFLWMLQRVNMGTLPDQWREAGLRDVLVVEWVSWLPLLILILVLGLYPRLVFGVTDEAVSGLMSLLGS